MQVSFDPDFGPVSGHGHESGVDYHDPRCQTVEVIHSSELMNVIFPGYWSNNLYFKIEPDVQAKAVADWCANNNAHFFSWEGPSYGRLAMQDCAILNAVALGKSKVVIEALS